MTDSLMLLDWQRRIGPLNKRYRAAKTQAEREVIADDVLDQFAVSAAENAFVASISGPFKMQPAEADRFIGNSLKAQVRGWCRYEATRDPDVAAQEMCGVVAPAFWRRVRELQAATSATWGRA